MIFLLLVTCVSAALAGQAFLTLSTQGTEIDIDPASAERRALRLPGLEFHFLIEARCPESQQARSLLVSIADSRKRVAEAALQAALESGLSVTVPARQIAPVAVEDFCLDEQPADARSEIIVKGLLSAQGALSCSSDSDSSVTYASASLDVRLRCARQSEADDGVIELP